MHLSAYSLPCIGAFLAFVCLFLPTFLPSFLFSFLPFIPSSLLSFLPPFLVFSSQFRSYRSTVADEAGLHEIRLLDKC